MSLKLFERIRRHASVSSGNFERIFHDAEIPPLPAAISHLVVEVGRDEPDFQKIVKMITALPDIAVKVLKTINSAYYSLPNPVNNVMHAVTVLGLNNIRPLILSFAMKESLPVPPANLFNQDAFWSDSLIKSLFARSFAERHCRADREEAFTAMLLADVALPVLLNSWGEYYQTVTERWQNTSKRLSVIERKSFQWDHAQAGAWILQHWEFPVELVCFVGLHNTSTEKLAELELTASVALPVIVAANTPSTLKPDPARASLMMDMAMQQIGFDEDEIATLLGEVRHGYHEISELFGLTHFSGDVVFDLLEQRLMPEAGQDG